ncbi:arylsulfatase [Autumnicola musiva]|uniref:Arylsulfatase n=1 Tax=Autumnicola musiva TaxID=3075589 RepID=A0ABU3DAB2_9FLAO|nr:arylsulfatase [Zunongwangia sp. F117]MDT0677898.1 arylsulfatase [Zunongwangia sp. F117]
MKLIFAVHKVLMKSSPVKLMISILLLFIPLLLWSFKDTELEDRPNIIIIMADDLGFSDLGCYGGEIHTPNIDKLGYNGVRMNAFYNTSRCCPSRASLLTGLYPHQAGLGRMTHKTDLPGYQGTLDNNTVTIAEVLKKSGYQTGMVGKWHVSETPVRRTEEQLEWLAHQNDYGDFSDTSTYPTSRGFEKYYGNIWGVVDYYDPFSLVNDKNQVKSVPQDYYHTTAIGDSAVAYVHQFSKKDNPFFLYVAHTAPHWPLQAPDSVIAKYEERYKMGWKQIRATRYQSLIEKGVIRSDTSLPYFMFPEREWRKNRDTLWDVHAMATHAAMIDILDQTVGNLLNELEKTGELDNTIIFFLSDNGASSERPSEYGPGFDRPGETRTGEKIQFPVEKDFLSGPQTVTSGIGPEWAHVANTPFRYWKARVYEGGITTPFIAHWPAGLTNKGDVIQNTASHITDLMATCLDLAGAEYPKSFQGRYIKPTVGKSIMPILKRGDNQNSQKDYFWEHFGAAALRSGDWKIVRLDAQSEWNLYNLKQDRTEVHNLSYQYPQRLNLMKEQWEKLANQYQVYPAPTN